MHASLSKFPPRSYEFLRGGNKGGRVAIPASFSLAQRFEDRHLSANRNLLRPSGDFVAKQRAERLRLRSEIFACEPISFACETILFRRAPHKLLKSLGYEISTFGVSCNFKGLWPILFRAYNSQAASSCPTFLCVSVRPIGQPPRVPDLVGSRLSSPYPFRVGIQSLQAVAAPFPGGSNLALSLSRRDPADRNASVQKSTIGFGGLRQGFENKCRSTAWQEIY
jgi:hypothetical protein